MDKKTRIYSAALIAVFVVSLLAGCGGGGGSSPAVTPGAEAVVVFSGPVPVPQGAPSIGAASMAASYPELSVAAYDVKTKAETAGVIDGANYRISVAAPQASAHYILVIRSSGRVIFRNYAGEVPPRSEFPTSVRSVTVSPLSFDEKTTALAAFGLEKSVAPVRLFSGAGLDASKESQTVDFSAIKSSVESPLEDSAGGAATVAAVSAAVRSVVAGVGSPSVSEAVKKEVYPGADEFASARGILNSFVNAVKNPATLAVVKARSLSESVSVGGKTIDSGSTPADVETAAGAIKPLERVVKPVISPAGGSFTSTTEVSLSSATAGATIKYSLDGSDPATNGTVYGGAFLLSSSATVKAVAFKTGASTSEVATASFEIKFPGVVSAPVLSHRSGTYVGTIEVIVSCATPDAVVYYSEDGSVPSSASKMFTGKIVVGATRTIKAVAVRSGLSNSSVVSVDYTIIQRVSMPTFDPPSGVYYETISVTILPPSGLSEVFYGLGTDPAEIKNRYSGPITVFEPVTINAVSVSSGKGTSEIATAAYIVKKPDPIPAVINMFYDINTRNLRWQAVTTNNKKYIYVIKLDDVILISPSLTPQYDASGLSPGTHKLEVSAMLEGSNPPQNGPYSDPYEFRVPSAVNLPAINKAEYSSSGIIVWEPKIDRTGKNYDYRVMFNNDVSSFFLSRTASFGIPESIGPGYNTVRVQAISLDTSNQFEFKIIEEGNWCQDQTFMLPGTDRNYLMISVPRNLRFDNAEKTIKWDVTGASGNFRYDILATYSAGGSYHFNEGLGLGLTEHSVTLAEVTAKLPSDVESCLLEVVSSDGFENGLKSNAIPLPVVIEGGIPQVLGLYYDTDNRVIRWQPVGGSKQSYTYTIRIDGAIRSEGLLTTEYSAAELSQVTHEVEVRAVLKNSIPPLEGPYSEMLVFSNRSGAASSVTVPKVTEVAYGGESQIVTWKRVVVEGRDCYYAVKIDGKVVSEKHPGPVYGVSALSIETHEIMIRAIIVENGEIVNQGPYSDAYNFMPVVAKPVKAKLGKVDARNFFYDRESNLVKWFPLDAREAKGVVPDYIVELDGKLQSAVDSASFGMPGDITLGQHTLRVKARIPKTEPPIEGPFSEFFNFNVTSSTPAYKEIKQVSDFKFDTRSQTMNWGAVTVANQQVKYFVIVYIDTGAGLTEQSFPTFGNAGYLGVLKLDPRFQSLPSGLYTFEIQASIANTNKKGLKSKAVVLNLNDKTRDWEEPEVDLSIFNE